MFKLLTKKHRTINHKIIFNDSISTFYRCNIWGFCQGISMFFSICLSKRKKKKAEVIKFLKILKKYVSENKIYFSSRKKSKFLLNKKIIFVFHTIFKLDFIFCFISVSKKWNKETMLTFSYWYKWQKFRTCSKNIGRIANIQIIPNVIYKLEN